MHYQISLNYTDPPQSVSSSQNPRVDLPFVCKAKPSHMGVGLKGVEPAKRGLVVQLLVELLLPDLCQNFLSIKFMTGLKCFLAQNTHTYIITIIVCNMRVKKNCGQQKNEKCQQSLPRI